MDKEVNHNTCGGTEDKRLQETALDREEGQVLLALRGVGQTAYGKDDAVVIPSGRSGKVAPKIKEKTGKRCILRSSVVRRQGTFVQRRLLLTEDVVDDRDQRVVSSVDMTGELRGQGLEILVQGFVAKNSHRVLTSYALHLLGE